MVAKSQSVIAVAMEMSMGKVMGSPIGSSTGTVGSIEALSQRAPGTVAASYCELVELVLPQHANSLGITFGGNILRWIEHCAVVFEFEEIE
jgi:hypothetical protein